MITQPHSSLPLVVNQKRDNELQFISFLRVKRGIKFVIEGFKSMPPITRYITFICLGIFSIQLVLMGLSIDHRLYFELYSINSPKFYLHQIFTSSFAHDDFSHLIFNLVYFCLLGSICEKLIGKHFIRLIIFTIFIDTSLWMLLNPKGGALGLSVVVSSILIILLLMRNNLPILLNFAIKFLCLVFMFSDIIRVIIGILDNKFDENTGSSALHCVGFSAGIMYMTIYVFFHRFKASRFYPTRMVSFFGRVIEFLKRKMVNSTVSLFLRIKNFFTIATLKSYVRTATFWLIVVNTLLFLIHVIISEYSDFKFNDFLSSYNIHSENFHLFTLITSNFSHADFDHIFWNLLLFMLVGFAVERRLGVKKYALIITISSFSSSFLFHIDDYFVQKEMAVILKQHKLTESDIKFTPTKEVDVKNSSIFKKLKPDKAWDISHKFGFSKGNAKGFSGCLFAIMACFLVLFHYKRFVLNLFVVFFIVLNVIVLFEKNLYEHFTQLVHLGGVAVGFIFTVVVLVNEHRKRRIISRLKYNQLT
ncbi:MAG: rhomboid family intramembrane serine protease [Bacteroidota bacterium]